MNPCFALIVAVVAVVYFFADWIFTDEPGIVSDIGLPSNFDAGWRRPGNETAMGTTIQSSYVPTFFELDIHSSVAYADEITISMRLNASLPLYFGYCFTVFDDDSVVPGQNVSLVCRGNVKAETILFTVGRKMGSDEKTSACPSRFVMQGFCLEDAGQQHSEHSRDLFPQVNGQNLVISYVYKSGEIRLMQDESSYLRVCRSCKGGTSPMFGMFLYGLVKFDELDVATAEDIFIRRHQKRGATLAKAGSCGSKSALCGGKCFGVCEMCRVKHCMCYPNGFRGESGIFHDGPKCLKRDGDGDKIETPSVVQPDKVTSYMATPDEA